MAAVLMTTLLSAAMAPSWLGRAPAALRVPAIVSRGRPASMDLPNIDGTGAFRDVQVRSRFRLFFTAAVFFFSRVPFLSKLFTSLMMIFSQFHQINASDLSTG